MAKKLDSIANEKLKDPTGVAVSGSSIFVTDRSSCSLLKFDKAGKLLKSLGGQHGCGKGEFCRPHGLIVVGDEVIVCDTDNCRLQVFTTDLVFIRQIGSPGNDYGELNCPVDIAHDGDSNLYVTGWGNDCVQVFTTQGKFLRILVGIRGIIKPMGIATDRELVYITSTRELCIYHKSGDKVCTILPTHMDFACLWGVAVDHDGFIYVCDPSNNQVIIF